MSSFEFDQSEEMEGAGGYLSKPGTYHLIIANVDPEPHSKDGKPLNGLRVEGEVLEGTEQSELKKTFEFLLFAPKATDKNNGEMAKRKLTRLAYALGFIATHQPGQRISIDCEAAVGRQIIAKFSESESGKKFVDLNYSDIYHVDDPAVEHVPKLQSALVAIPAELRKQTQPTAKTNGHAKQMATAGTAPSLDDI